MYIDLVVRDEHRSRFTFSDGSVMELSGGSISFSTYDDYSFGWLSQIWSVTDWQISNNKVELC